MLQSSTLLVTPHFSALSLEICKNLVLAGVGSLTLVESTPSTVTEEDVGLNWAVREEEIGQAVSGSGSGSYAWPSRSVMHEMDE